MYLPNLFGAYVAGRQQAIEDNWKDLSNYEDIEAKRNANDLSALDILRQRAKFGGEMSIFQNNVDQSSRANEVANVAQPGLLARADMGANAAQVQRSVFNNNLPSYAQTLNDLFSARLGQQANTATALRGQNDYLNGARAYEMGTMRGQDGYNTATANNITAANAPARATATNQLWDKTHELNILGTNLGITQNQNSIANQPLIQANTQQSLLNNAYSLANVIPEDQLIKERLINQAIQQKQANLLQLQREYETTGSPAVLAAIQQLQAELGQLIQPQGGTQVQTQAQVQPQAQVQQQTQPQIATINGKPVVVHPSGIITDENGNVIKTTMTIQEAARRKAAEDLLGGTKPQNYLAIPSDTKGGLAYLTNKY